MGVLSPVIAQVLRGAKIGPRNLVVAAIGDSLTAQSVTTAIDSFFQQDFRGSLPWLRGLSGQRFYLPGVAIKGVGGNRLDQMLARITEVTATTVVGPDGASVLPGTVKLTGGANDIGQGASYETVISRLEACIQAIRSAGQVVVLTGPTPQATTTTWTVGQLSVLAQFRDYIRARHNPAGGVYVADPWNDVAGAADAVFAAPTMLRDTTHWHPKAAYLVAVREAAAMATLFPTPRPLTQENLVLNPTLSGAAGTKSGGITGDVATSWVASTATLTGDQVITASVVDIGGGQFAQQFAVSGTWASGSDVGMSQTLAGWGTTYNPGDIMSMDGVVSVSGINPDPTARHRAGVGIIYKSGGAVDDGQLNAAGEPTPGQTPLDLNLRVERFTHPADATRNTPRFVYAFPAGTHNFTMRFHSPRYVRHATA